MSGHLREQWASLKMSSLPKTSARRYFHGTGATLAAGDSLRGGGSGNYQPETYTSQGSIYVTDAPDMAFFYAVFGPFSSADFSATPHVYEVDAVDPRPAQMGEWTVAGASVVADVTSQAKAEFARKWEAVWKPMIEGTPRSGIPTVEMIVREFESRLR